MIGRFKPIKFGAMLYCLLVILCVGCNGDKPAKPPDVSSAITDLEPLGHTGEAPACAPSEINVVFDHSLSMDGYVLGPNAKITHPNHYYCVLKGMQEVLGKTYEKVFYYKLGKEMIESNAEDFLDKAYNRAENTHFRRVSPMGDVFRKWPVPMESSVTILISDLAMCDQTKYTGLSELLRGVKEYRENGAVALIGIRTAFDGYIYDYKPDAGIPLVDGERPFYLLILGAKGPVHQVADKIINDIITFCEGVDYHLAHSSHYLWSVAASGNDLWDLADKPAAGSLVPTSQLIKDYPADRQFLIKNPVSPYVLTWNTGDFLTSQAASFLKPMITCRVWAFEGKRQEEDIWTESTESHARMFFQEGVPAKSPNSPDNTKGERVAPQESYRIFWGSAEHPTMRSDKEEPPAVAAESNNSAEFKIALFPSGFNWPFQYQTQPGFLRLDITAEATPQIPSWPSGWDVAQCNINNLCAGGVPSFFPTLNLSRILDEINPKNGNKNTRHHVGHIRIAFKNSDE